MSGRSVPTVPTARARRPVRRSSPTLMSRPMVTMKNSIPTRATAVRAPGIGPVVGNSQANTSGASRPRIVGPSRSPPAISPTTAGIPSRRATAPSPIAASSMAARCNDNTVQSADVMAALPGVEGDRPPGPASMPSILVQTIIV